MKHITENVTVKKETFEYCKDELRERYEEFVEQCKQDAIQDFTLCLEREQYDYAKDLVDFIPKTPFDELTDADMLDAYLFPVLFHEVTEAHYKLKKAGNYADEVIWLQNATVKIYEKNNMLVKIFSVKDGEW